MKLTRYEQETVILYNNEEKCAVCCTYDKALIRRLDKLVAAGESILVEKDCGEYKEYKFPKKYVKVRPPIHISDEKRDEMSKRMKAAWERKRAGNVL